MMKFKKKDWDGYSRVAEKYLARPQFKGTPLSAEMLSGAAKKTYEETGVFIPVELALAQGQLESHLGTKGRNPSTNPYNVGEYDAGTKRTFKDAGEGVSAYFNLMAKDYLGNNTVDGLRKNFVNKDGNRYASNPNYETMVDQQMNFIAKHYSGQAR